MGQRGRSVLAPLGQGHPQKARQRFQAQVTEASRAGDRVLDQRQTVAFQQEGVEALCRHRQAEAALGIVVEGGRGQPEAPAALSIQQERLGDSVGIGGHEQEEHAGGMTSPQVLVHQPGQEVQRLLGRKAMLDFHIGGLVAPSGKPGIALRVAV